MSTEETKSLSQEIDKLEVHPLIKAQEKTDETTVEFCGFVGTANNEVLRLYTELDTSVYVEIPKDAVVYLEKVSDGVKGKVRIFVSATKEITEVSKQRRAASQSLFSVTSMALRLPLPPRGIPIDGGGFDPIPKDIGKEGKECYEECEAVFAVRAANVLMLYAQADSFAIQFGVNDIRYQDALRAANQAEDDAAGRLRECLRQCPVLYVNFAKTVANLIVKYLG